MNILKSLSRQDSSPPQVTKRQHIPWIQSPLADDEGDASASNTSLPAVGQPRRDPDVPHFREPAENTQEILYDLFFVANLSNFNSLHPVEDRTSLQNFIGFFTILWFTYLQTMIRDIRFAQDSVFDRVFKAINFGVMAGFGLAGASFDVSDVEGNSKGFKLLFMTLMISRLALMIQYGVVLYYVRFYKRTNVPLIFSILLLGISAAVFLAIFFAFDGGVVENGHIAVYTVSVVEAVSMLSISCIYKVVSFKHTRFARRLGDLSLIMLGEGILGLIISLSKIMQNSAHISGSIGVTISGVALIYFIWMLYFDQIEHERFGAIRQQIWAILHYPLNLAMILLVEGNKELIAYNTIVTVDERWLSWYDGSIHDEILWTDFSDFESGTDLADYLQQALDDLGTVIKNDNSLDSTFNTTMLLDAVKRIPENMTSPEWTTEGNAYAASFSVMLFMGVEAYILEHFGVTGPDPPPVSDFIEGGNATLAAAPSEYVNLLTSSVGAEPLWNVVDTVFIYFPIAAGSFLLLLAVMYHLGKRKKSRDEAWSILLRVVVGLVLAVGYTLILYYVDLDWKLKDSVWPIGVVSLAYFIVIMGDNMLIWRNNREYEERGLLQRMKETPSYQHVPSRGGEGSDVELAKMHAATGKYY